MDILARHQCICLVGETGNGIILMDNKVYEKEREKAGKLAVFSSLCSREEGGEGVISEVSNPAHLISPS